MYLNDLSLDTERASRPEGCTDKDVTASLLDIRINRKRKYKFPEIIPSDTL